MGGMLGGGSVDAPTIDPSEAIAAFHSGADIIAQAAPAAYQNYITSLGVGARQQMDAFTAGQNLGRPFSDTARDANDELRLFMGLAPIDKSASDSANLRNLVDKFNSPGVGLTNERSPVAMIGSGLTSTISSFADRLDALRSSTDPATRAAGIDALRQDMSQLEQGIMQDRMMADNMWRIYGSKDSFGAGGVTTQQLTAPRPTYTNLLGNNFGANLQYMQTTTGRNPSDNPYSPEELARIKADLTQRTGQAFNDPISNPSKYFGITGQENLLAQKGINDAEYARIGGFLNEVRDELKSISGSLETTFSKDPLTPWTPQQISDKLTQTPQYQFQLEQGSKAMERSQAARGILQSGNALIEGQKFGQGLAESVYSSHLQRLAGLAGLNLPLVQGGQGLSVQSGAAGFQTGALSGIAQQQAIMDPARSRESAFIRQGQTLYDAAKTNAQMQLQASMANAQMQQQSAAGFGQLAGSILGGLF